MRRRGSDGGRAGPTRVVATCVSLAALALTVLVPVTAEAATPLVTSPPPANGYAGVPYDHTFTATTTPHWWAITEGTLPDGLALHPVTGELTGTPTVATAAPITVQARWSAA